MSTLMDLLLLLRPYCHKSENVLEGSTVLLHYCNFTTPVEHTNLTFRWFKPEMAGQRLKHEVTHEGYLSINNAQESDSGIYFVEIQNEWGSTLHIVELMVTPAQTGRLFILMCWDP